MTYGYRAYFSKVAKIIHKSIPEKILLNVGTFIVTPRKLLHL